MGRREMFTKFQMRILKFRVNLGELCICEMSTLKWNLNMTEIVHGLNWFRVGSNSMLLYCDEPYGKFLTD
jgi:hypothetical protein